MDIDYAIIAPSCKLLKKLREKLERNNISIIEIPHKEIFSLRHCGVVSWSESVHYALLVDQLISPERKLVLYMDADTLTLKGWDAIFETDLGDHPFAALRYKISDSQAHGEARRLKAFFDLNHDQAYALNSGVVLYNYPIATEKKIFKKALKLIRTHPARPNDQEALAVAAEGSFQELDPSYNFIPKHHIDQRVPVKIRHFAYKYKPWLLDRDGNQNECEDSRIFRSLLTELDLEPYMDVKLAKKHRPFIRRLERKFATWIYTGKYKRNERRTPDQE